MGRNWAPLSLHWLEWIERKLGLLLIGRRFRISGDKILPIQMKKKEKKEEEAGKVKREKKRKKKKNNNSNKRKLDACQ